MAINESETTKIQAPTKVNQKLLLKGLEMKKKCYHCEKISIGSIMETGVFICQGCQEESEEYGRDERRDQIDRIGIEGVNAINIED